MEDDLNFFEMDDDLKKLIEQKTIKIKAKKDHNLTNNPKQFNTTFVGN